MSHIADIQNINRAQSNKINLLYTGINNIPRILDIYFLGKRSKNAWIYLFLVL